MLKWLVRFSTFDLIRFYTLETFKSSEQSFTHYFVRFSWRRTLRYRSIILTRVETGQLDSGEHDFRGVQLQHRSCVDSAVEDRHGCCFERG